VAVPPQSPPVPPPAGSSCGGLVATDSTGDATNPVLAVTGSVDQVDITSLAFGMSPDGGSLTTTVTLKNFTTSPAPGTLGAYYRVVWKSGRRNPDGTITTTTWATEAGTDVSGAVTYRYGRYDGAEDTFVGTTAAATGTFTTGPEGTLKVTVPLSYLSALPAVIEPYALVFVHEEAVYFVSPVERAPDFGFAGSNWAVCLPDTTECLDDSDPRIAYSDGWHTVNDTTATNGHYRFHAGRSPDHSATLTFDVPAGRTGEVTYAYGTSTKGGSADMWIDGVPTTISYAGSAGGLKDPALGATARFANLAPGQHTLEIRNMQGAVYVDGFCLGSSTPDTQPASGPGATTTRTVSVGAGQRTQVSLTIGADATAISVVAASGNNAPIRVILIGASGTILEVGESGADGIAALSAPVAGAGTYILKVLNLGLEPTHVWTAATPTVDR
jgi:hypothetical protein